MYPLRFGVNKRGKGAERTEGSDLYQNKNDIQCNDKYSARPIGPSNTLKNSGLIMMYGFQNKQEAEFFYFVKTVIKKQNMIEVIQSHATVLLA